MPYAIELLLDAPTDRKIRAIGARLERRGVPTIFSFPGGEPHVALAVFEHGDLSRLKLNIKKIASKLPKMEARLSSVGSFPGMEGILFLSPVATIALLSLNRQIHGLLKKTAWGVWDYYKPGWWVPHCTLCMKLPAGKMLQGLDQVKKMNFGLVGRFNRLVLVEVSGKWPPMVQVLYSIPLPGKMKLKTKG